MGKVPIALEWKQSYLSVLDQTALPINEKFIDLHTMQDVYEAIVTLKVRGAPIIGLSAAYGLAIAVQTYEDLPIAQLHKQFEQDVAYLASSRPTAVNLFWALNKMSEAANTSENLQQLQHNIISEAIRLHHEDETRCRSIGEHALTLLEHKTRVLTICNAGSIATAKYGTALAPFHLAAETGKYFEVFACETRPVLQGSRLTAWELQKAGVDVTLITDSMAAHTIAEKKIEAIIVGADRIAGNGDTANKIGTRGLAILAKSFGIPFYVAAPTSTFDLSIANGQQIPIEERSPNEITQIAGVQTAPDNVKVFNPAFDVTPAEYISAIITEKGIIYPDFIKNIKENIIGRGSSSNL